jgi:hypothetical protein
MRIALDGPALLEVYEVPAGSELELFRIVRNADLDDPRLSASFMSNFQTGKPPRGSEYRSAVIQMGLSMYEESSQAEQTARAFPIIGRYIARLLLTTRSGFNLASTGQAGHWTVWGRPDQFVAAIADIYPW